MIWSKVVVMEVSKLICYNLMLSKIPISSEPETEDSHTLNLQGLFVVNNVAYSEHKWFKQRDNVEHGQNSNYSFDLNDFKIFESGVHDNR